MAAEPDEWLLSTPDQQVISLINTRDFLARLADPKQTPKVPRVVRSEARALLRHYLPESRLRPLIEAQVQDQPRRRTGTKREPRLIPRSRSEFQQEIQRYGSAPAAGSIPPGYALPW